MTEPVKKYWLAVATLVGTIIGVGIFGVPYALSKVGVLLGLVYFFMLGGIQLLQHLFFAEAAIATPEKKRLVGLADAILGKKARHVAAVASVLGFWGAMVAYILVGGSFLHLLLAPFLGGDAWLYQFAWAAIGGVVIYFGLGIIAKFEFWLTLALILALCLIFGASLPQLRPENIAWFTVEDFFLPYGIILFSLSGLAAIPEMEDIIGEDRNRLRSAIVAGSVAATLLTALFGFAILGVTGGATSEDALSGLQAFFSPGLIALVGLFGFLAVATSYFTIGVNLRETFEYDYKIKRLPSWLGAVGVPTAVFFAGAGSFVGIIGFTGAVFNGITAILVALLYIAVVKKRLVAVSPLGLSVSFARMSIAVLAVGAVYEVAVSFLKIFS